MLHEIRRDPDHVIDSMRAELTRRNGANRPHRQQESQPQEQGNSKPRGLPPFGDPALIHSSRLCCIPILPCSEAFADPRTGDMEETLSYQCCRIELSAQEQHYLLRLPSLVRERSASPLVGTMSPEDSARPSSPHLWPLTRNLHRCGGTTRQGFLLVDEDTGGLMSTAWRSSPTSSGSAAPQRAPR